jgi:hypothetical protein
MDMNRERNDKGKEDHFRGVTETVRVRQIQQDDYISLTDIAKCRNADDPRFVIQNWMRTRFTLDFLGMWEQLNNLDFNRVEFKAVKKK